MATYSSDTYATLRNVRLLDAGEMDGKHFVRCIPTESGQVYGRVLTAPERVAIILRAISEIGEDGICLSNNPDYGGDYLRVETRTRTYRLICQMLS